MDTQMWILKQTRLLLTTVSTHATDLGQEPWISHVCRSTATLRGVLWLSQSHCACPSASLWGWSRAASLWPWHNPPVSTKVQVAPKGWWDFEFHNQVEHRKKGVTERNTDSLPQQDITGIPSVANLCYSKGEGQ